MLSGKSTLSGEYQQLGIMQMLSGKSTLSGEILTVGDIAEAVREVNSFR
jgi:hypothetical protein